LESKSSNDTVLPVPTSKPLSRVPRNQVLESEEIREYVKESEYILVPGVEDKLMKAAANVCTFIVEIQSMKIRSTDVDWLVGWQ